MQCDLLCTIVPQVAFLIHYAELVFRCAVACGDLVIGHVRLCFVTWMNLGVRLADEIRAPCGVCAPVGFVDRDTATLGVLDSHRIRREFQELLPLVCSELYGISRRGTHGEVTPLSCQVLVRSFVHKGLLVGSHAE